MRDLPPAAAALAVNAEALAVVRRAMATREEMRRSTGMAGGLPTLERMMRDDVAMAQIRVPEAGEISLRPVLRAVSLEAQLERAGFDRARAWAGERFARDVEAMTIGKLTGSYGEGLGGGTAAEPLRMIIAMDRVAKATGSLNRQERTAAWAVLVFGLTMTDTGWSLFGHRAGGARARLVDAAWLFLDAALEKMQPFYEALGDDTA
ncbi:hypothetical protein [uncultured Brevundimonas sp.]|uniref:hypothetical protein n=1 Tax=uncultured Brevundimonas sp. TaxID=213418 RepID=UPI0026348B41|nr:hypothetical protein [uncultured Brevundimonas sp.]